MAESRYIFTITPEQRNALLSPENDLNNSLREAFQPLKDTFDEQGFVLVRGLLDESLLQRLCNASQTLGGPTQGPALFSSLEFGPVFDTEEKVYRDASIYSSIPALIARVLLNTKDDENCNDEAPTLRLLKDAFLAKGLETGSCGWHVDDNVFWPTDASSDGVNTWLALDDIPKKYGGGLAISPKSHTAEWKKTAYDAIGSTPTLPPEGITPEKLLKTFGQTCDIANLNKEVHDRIEVSKMVFDYKKGDCLFCKRWLFHRSMPINEEGTAYYNEGTKLKRYTIRYERGDAKLIRGISLEPSILMNSANSGRSLDEVCNMDGPYYPQCWPPLDVNANREQELQMDKLAKDTLPLAQTKKTLKVKALMAEAKKDKPTYSA